MAIGELILQRLRILFYKAIFIKQNIPDKFLRTCKRPRGSQKTLFYFQNLRKSLGIMNTIRTDTNRLILVS